jgi:transcription factor SPN1
MEIDLEEIANTNQEDVKSKQIDQEDEENEAVEETEETDAKVAENDSEAENESDEEFAGFGDEEEIKTNSNTKKRQTLSDDSEDDVAAPKQSKNADDLDDEEVEGEEEEQDQDELIETEDVDEEEQGKVETEEVVQEQEESEDEEIERPVKKNRSDKPSDLEMMLQRNKEQKAKNRRRNKTDSEEINDWDNKISIIISEMKNVAAEDRAANEKNLMSLQKHKMMSTVVNMLQKTDYHATMIELGVLGAIAEWLAPLPDRSLPNVSIREFMIETLRDFGEINADYLKSSGIGKAVMFLYKHSKETKENKQRLERLINDWSRPIFNLDGNFKQLSKEERLERDLEHVKMMNRREKTNQGRTIDDLLDATENPKSKNKKKKNDKAAVDEPKKFLRPGEVGFCPRARVPIPSSKDYVIRPKSNVEVNEAEESRKGGKKSESRLDKHKKRFEELKRQSKSSRAVTMVAAGGK